MVADDASSIHPSNLPTPCISAMIQHTEAESVILTEMYPKDFSFDQEILMTPAYRKVVTVSGQQRNVAATAEGSEYAYPKIPAESSSPGPSVPFTSVSPINDGLTKEEHSSGYRTNVMNKERHLKGTITIPRKPLPISTAKHKEDVIRKQSFAGKCGEEDVVFYGPINGQLVPSTVTASYPDSLATDALKKITLYDLMPPLLDSTKLSARPKRHREKLWVTHTEINVIGQELQFIPREVINAVQTSLKS